MVPDEPIRLHQQFRCQRCRIPDTGRHEMMQLIILARSQARRHRLNTLPLARSDQPRNVEGAHPPTRLVAQAGQEALEPTLQFVVPIQPRLP